MADVFDEIEATVLLAMDTIGRTIADEIRDSLATPFPGPSVAGESPHRRTGTLQAGIVVDPVDHVGHVFTLTITSTAPYSQRLEDMGRPFMSAALATWSTEIVIQLQGYF